MSNLLRPKCLEGTSPYAYHSPPALLLHPERSYPKYPLAGEGAGLTRWSSQANAEHSRTPHLTPFIGSGLAAPPTLKEVEKVGSPGGQTSRRVTIASCGQPTPPPGPEGLMSEGNGPLLDR